MQKQRSGRGRVRPPEDRAGRDRPKGSVSPSAVEEPLGACPVTDAGVRRWWRKAERDWPQLNRRDRQQLLEYCRIRVRIERWERTVADEGEIVKGNRLNPLMREIRMWSGRADRLVRDFAGTAGTRERARPVVREEPKPKAELHVLKRGKPV